MSNIAIYLRISVEERTGRESESIGNQRIFLRDYISKNDEFKGMTVTEYMDDGYSGSSENRPEFQKMLEDLRNNKIDCIIVKDLSRFARDYILLGDYLENILPFMGVRFIAVNDGYDSNEESGNGTELDVQFKGLLYDFYCKDCSKKVKSVQNAQKRQGKFLAWQPPYGYMKDPEDKHQIILDEETAPIVKEIYEMSLSGLSTRKIAKILTERGVSTPGERKKEISGYDFTKRVIQTEKEHKPNWPHGTVIDILANEMYTGTYIFNKFENKTIGARSSRKSDKSKWERVYNHHEPIISKELFDKVQEAKKSRGFNYKRDSKDFYKKSPIQGFAKCAECGHIYSITKSVSVRRKGNVPIFYMHCRTCKIRGEHKHVTLRVDKYEKIVYEALKERIGEEKLKEELDRKQDNSKDLIKEMERLESRLDKLNTKKRKSLEKYKLEKITREEFMSLKEEIELEKNELKDKLKEMEKELQEKKEAKKEKTNENEFTRELVNRYIDEILIDADGNCEIKFKN